MSERERSGYPGPQRRLRVRWLGRVPYRESDELQRALHRGADEHLLLLEHPHVYTLGRGADPTHVLVAPSDVGAELVATDRGGDVTYHGPGQLVGYPIITLPEWRDGRVDVVAYVRRLEGVLRSTCAAFGVDARTDPGYTGVWVGNEKIGAIGVRVAGGRARHGFALNVAPDLTMFEHIVPCGIPDRGVTSLAQLLGPGAPSMREVVDVAAGAFAAEFGFATERQDVAWRVHPTDLAPFTRDASGVQVRLERRLAEAGVPIPVADPTFRRPGWMKVRARLGSEYRDLRQLVRELDLHTVCEEAGCPNIYECWEDRTATFMILGDRCTRACGFCQVDTRRPRPPDPDEPARVAEAVSRLGLAHAVVTCVARDDLPDGGAGAFAATIAAIRDRTPDARVEVLISDCGGDPTALDTIFDARPDVLNHNLETVARLQRAARPSARYARSLAVLGRAKSAGLLVKSGIIVGMGETEAEVRGALGDLRAVGVDLVTIGQYLRPSDRHLPIARWWTPDEFAALAREGDALGFTHVEAGPLVRSSYHARRAVDATAETARG